MAETILLPGDGEKPVNEFSDPTVVLTEVPREIKATNLADEDKSRIQIRQDLASRMDDWGDGFYVEPEPVHVSRAPDGSIARVTPLSEIPGVNYQSARQAELEPLVAEERPALVPLGTADREKLVGFLSLRLYNYYRDRGPGDPRYNPFRDGIPELPAGSPEHIQPLPGTSLYPATDGQIRDYLRRFVVDRATLINTKRFGGNTIQDIALRIE
jgi:hypothetical protein